MTNKKGKGNSKSNYKDKDEVQGSLHCATDGETVRCFGRNDVYWGREVNDKQDDRCVCGE
jgi:hypothetical protein